MDNLLNFPISTFVDKLVPKAKFVKASDTPTALREYLSGEIEQIKILYVLRSDTLNVAPGEEVKEIDVFFLRMKNDSYGLNSLCGLDKLILRHTLLVINYGNKHDLIMHHKQRVEHQGKVSWKCTTTEIRENITLERGVLVLEGNNMDTVYTNLLSQMSDKQIDSITDYKEQKQEDERISKIKNEIDKLERQARKETQPRKKFELVQRINRLKMSL